MSDWFMFFGEYASVFCQGVIISINLTIVGLGIGFIIGIITALARVYGGKWLRRVAIAYTELIRGTPILVQLFLIYFGLPELGITLDRMTAAYITIGLNSGAYQSEYFRGAIQSIRDSQMLAARSVGMSRLQAIRYIILPQVIRLVIPAWSNEPIGLMKTSAIVFLIGIPDLMGTAKIIATRTFEPIKTYYITAIIYILIMFIMIGSLTIIAKRIGIPGLDVKPTRH